MNESTKGPLFWIPRLIGIGFALFIAVFAFDVFESGASPWRIAGALFMHLIPTWIVLAIVALSWRWGLVGAFGCAAAGAAQIALKWGQLAWYAFALISGPLFLLAVLFAIDWARRNRPGPTARKVPA